MYTSKQHNEELDMITFAPDTRIELKGRDLNTGKDAWYTGRVIEQPCNSQAWVMLDVDPSKRLVSIENLRTA